MPPSRGPARTLCRSYFIFLTFYTFGTFLTLNLFIVVILDNFSYWYQQDSVRLERNDFREYVARGRARERATARGWARSGLGPGAGKKRATPGAGDGADEGRGTQGRARARGGRCCGRIADCRRRHEH